MNPPAYGRSRAFWAFVAYLGFVVYGSLVPFELRPVPLDEALARFAAIPYLVLGEESRADWVANILLYVPLAFLGCNWLVGMRTAGAMRRLSAILVLGFCVVVAVAVEFTQQFFAPRTVSLNDLWAETIGSFIGLALFATARLRIADMLESFARGGRESVIAAAVAYGLVYAFLSAFPYDFLISWRELTEKFDSANIGWFVAGECGGFLRCSVRHASEAGAIAPLGLLLALARPKLPYRSFFAAGAALGLVLELLQILLVSGISQGLSLLLRGLGMVAGAAAGRYLRRQGPKPSALLISKAAPLLALPYVLLLLALSGWFSAPWASLHEALARLPAIRIMPFYYHYWTTETEAMTSLLAQAGMYAPIGMAWWARRSSHGASAGNLAAAGLAAGLALPIELGKLFLAATHPDPTNLLIAAAASAAACSLANWMECVLREGLNLPLPAVAHKVQPAKAYRVPLPPLAVFKAGLCALAILIGVIQYPNGQIWLCAALIGYCALLWHRPWFCLFAIPALLPTLDLSPITGSLLIDEFDLFVLASLAIAYLKTHADRPRNWPNRWLAAAFILLLASWLASSLRGLWPLFAADSGMLESSHSPLEAWKVGKGMLWALLLVPILRRAPLADDAPRRLALGGLLLGLGLVTLDVILERHVYVGLFDFENVFRVTGTFSDMNSGGAYIEAFLSFAFPALAASALTTRRWPLIIIGITSAGFVSYATMATFSRVGYVALAAGLVPVALALVARKQAAARQWLALATLAAAATAVAIPVVSGGFAQSRLSSSSTDFTVRMAHWTRALNLMDNGPAAALFGMGFGQYPFLYALRADDVRPPGSYSIMREGGNPYLRLGNGEMVYLDQIVDVEPASDYKLTVRLRQPYGDASLQANLCEKALLYSFACVGTKLAPEGTDWRKLSAQLHSAALGIGGNWPYRTVKLSLGNAGTGGLIDVDDVSLKDENGRELLANGGFDDGVKDWLFVTDQDLAWHIHQMEVELYFAQGWLGLLALALLLMGAGKVLLPALWAGDLRAAAFAGSLTAFLAVGLLGSTMDTARLSMLFYWGAFCSVLLAIAHPSGKPGTLAERTQSSR